MSLTEAEISELRSVRFSLDAVRIRAKRRGDGRTYLGAGHIRQTESGRFTCTIYSTSGESSLDDWVSQQPGLLIPDDAFFDVHITDWRGRNWIASSAGVDTSSSTGVKGVIARCDIDQLTWMKNVEAKDRLWMFLPGQYRTPTNEGTRHTSITAGRESHSFDPNVWRIADTIGDITIKKSAEGLDLNLVAADRLLKGIDSRLEEALWFTLARPAQWTILDEVRRGRRRTLLRAHTPRPGTIRFRPPLDPGHGEPEDALGRMFGAYLSYVTKYRKSQYHPTSVAWISILWASGISIEAEALALTVALEGLAARGYPQLAMPRKKVIKSLGSALQHLENWDGDSATKTRIRGLIGSLKGRNGREALERLRALGRLSHEEISAWKRLRNPMAHGADVERAMPEMIELSNLVHMALLKVQFDLIGYEGIYTHRDNHGWRTATYSRSA